PAATSEFGVSIVDHSVLMIPGQLLMRNESSRTRVTGGKVSMTAGTQSQLHTADPQSSEIWASDTSPTLQDREETYRTRLPAMKELLRKIQSFMTNSGLSPTRLPYGSADFLESDSFKSRIAPLLPQRSLEMRLGQVKGMPQTIARKFPRNTTVGSALALNLGTFARRV